VAELVRPVAVEQVKTIPVSSISRTPAKMPTSRSWAFLLIDRGVLQGVLVVQTIEARVFSEDEIRMLTEAATQVAPVVSEARTLDRFIAPLQERLWALARNLWWSWDHNSSSLFLDLDPARWNELNHNPVALLSEMPLAKLETRAAELMLHSRVNYCLPPHAGVSGGTAPGERNMPEFCGRTRSPISPRSLACTNPCRFIPAASECWPAITSRAPPIWIFH
jgi:glycogen phosphorylase